MTDSSLLLVLGLAVVVALGVAIACLVVLVGRSRQDTGVKVLQSEIASVRDQGLRSQQDTREAVHVEIGRFGDRVGERLGQLQSAVAMQLQQVTAEVNQRLQDGMALMQDTHKTMGQRLDEASRAVTEVHGQLGALGESTRRMEQVGREIAGLEQILRAPKIRGGLGETLLERLLAEILPAEAYRLQHTFRSGDKVDAAVVLADRLVPVDSKFPLENFRRMLEETDEDRRRQSRRAFLKDVRGRVDEIAKKYIVPDEKTFDFALMYIPAENVYYEVILRDEAGDESLLGYALSRRVVPVSPNSLYAYLQVILLGLRGLRIEQNAREILGVLGRLQGDAARLREHFDTLGRHITNAKNKYDETTTSLARLEGKIEDVAGRGDQPALPGV
ncbi:MAG TPA: DNA recombination protein RmuC [Methylomirabilota bacterium]